MQKEPEPMQKESFSLETAWEEVKSVQAQATEGFLRKEDVKRALEVYEEYGPKHPSCVVRAAAADAEQRLTILQISKDGIDASRGTVRRFSSNLTGIHVEYDYYADEERELHEALKAEGFGARSKRKKIGWGWDVGTNEVPEELKGKIDLSNEPTEETLTSLFKINKHARKYARKAEKHYHRGKHGSARRNSSRKSALYSTKANVLSQIVSDADLIEKHRIDNRDYFCLYFGDYSFHVLPDEIVIDESLVEDETKELEDFEKDEDTGELNRSLKESLIHLSETFGANANKHLDPAKVKGYFVGWGYLG